MRRRGGVGHNVCVVEFFGVRHHSPTAARLVRQFIVDARPTAVLIEGPTEYNPHLGELMLDHQLPVMLYSWAPMYPHAPEDSPEWGVRRGSFYPMTSYSPEWVALRTAHAAEIPIEFIDLPWLAFADVAVAENRYAEGNVAPGAAERLQREFGVDDTASLIDELIEVDPELSLATYRERIELLGSLLRGETDPEIDAREAHMAYRIAEARRSYGDDMLVVCGAAHISGLRERLAGEVAAVTTWRPPPDDDRYGIALTPTSYAALDALDGYDAGQPSPGFYDALFTDRAAGRHDTSERLLGQVVTGLRKARQFISPADLIAVRTTAGALSQLRGHRQIWRTDLVEGITTALVKDDAGLNHPLLHHVYQALRGNQLGRLAEGTRQPPLTVELRNELESLGLTPTPRRRYEPADLSDDLGLRRSRLLHSLVALEVPGFRQVATADKNGVERWQLHWTPGFEGALVAAARYGGSREQAVSARLLGRAADITSDPAAATALILDAALCGVTQLSASLQARTEALLATASDISAIGDAVGTLMRLFRYDPILRATGRADLGQLLGTTFDRSVRLLERLTPRAEGPELERFVRAMRQLTDSAERVGTQLSYDLDGFHEALAVVIADDRQAATVRGAALGAQWLAGVRADAEIAELLSVVAVPEQLGDFVAGLLGVAREAALRRPEALLRLDSILTDLSDEVFFAALPGLRRAFSHYTPRERSQVAQLLLGDSAGMALISFPGSPDDAVAIAEFESQVASSLERFLGGQYG
ncbi:MAG: DUF5682 family protein [Propionibacteriaceae bacterium]|nr:DUF5682 family protein [Propionibacteriaceae bacterium]